jgi:hypothetical protein
MSKKLVFTLTTIILATIGLSVGQIPNLVGNWTGSYDGYTNSGSYIATNESVAINLVISEQTGRLLTGNLSELGQGTAAISGVIALDNKTFYMTEYDGGYDMGTVLSNDTIELLYLEDGEKGGAFIDEFHRVA